MYKYVLNKCDLHPVYPGIIQSPLQHMGRTTAALLFKKSLDSSLASTLASCKGMEKKWRNKKLKQLQQLHAPQHSNQVALPQPLHLQPLIEYE